MWFLRSELIGRRRRGEVTVLSGTAETTYRDPALVKRLLAAAPATDQL